MKIRLGVQSYCFRNTSENAKVAEMVKEIGLKRIELCRLHPDFAKVELHAPAIAAYKNAGVEIISTGVNKISGDIAADRLLFDFAKAAGSKVMSVNFSLATIDKELKSAEALAEEYDMKLGIHNHGGYHWLGQAEALAWVFSKSSPRVGLTLDTAWAIDAKQSPQKLAEEFASRLVNIHFKDFTYNPDRTHNDVPVGTGILNLKDFLATLEKVGYNGIGVLEYEGDPADPVPALKKCVSQMKQFMDID